MALKFCYQTKEGLICPRIPIKPLDIWSWLKEHPDWDDSDLFRPGPNPWTDIFKDRPGPTPWISNKVLEEGIMRDISILAVASAFTEHLSAELREPYKRAITSVISQLKLPSDATVEFL